jgi:hypothetical protein
MNRALRLSRPLLSALLVAGAALGCESPGGSGEPLPAASALAAPAPPAASSAAKFVVDAEKSQVELAMDAALERIRGYVPGGLEGQIDVDLMDLTRSTGFIAVDLGRLELTQSVKDEETETFLEAKQNGLQNEHARMWLEIGADAPDDMRRRYRRAEFAIREVTDASEKNVQAMKGNERQVTFIAKGDFLLHGKKATKSVNMQATFRYDGDKPVSVSVVSLSPLVVNLEDHDVRPREAYAVLAKQTLDLLSPRVAREAEIRLALTATVPGVEAAAASPAPAEKPVAAEPAGDEGGAGTGGGGGAPAALEAPDAAPAEAPGGEQAPSKAPPAEEAPSKAPPAAAPPAAAPPATPPPSGAGQPHH